MSAFGVQSDGTSIPNANQTEVSTFRLSPYLRGQLAGSTNYEARYAWTTTRTGTTEASDAKVQDARLLHHRLAKRGQQDRHRRGHQRCDQDDGIDATNIHHFAPMPKDSRIR